MSLMKNHATWTPAVSKRWFGAIASLQCCIICGRNQIQVAHSNQDRGKSQKAAPWLTAPICQWHHHQIDNGSSLSKHDRRVTMDRAIIAAHIQLEEERLIESAIITELAAILARHTDDESELRKGVLLINEAVMDGRVVLL